MARGRKRKVVTESQPKIENKIDLPLIEDIIDHKNDQSIQLEKIDPVKNEKPSFEKIDALVKKLPPKQEKKETINVIKKQEVVSEKPQVNIVTASKETSEKFIETNKKEKSLTTYPPKISLLISKLRLNPAYRYLPDQTLIKIASTKLRSRYFFNSVKRDGGVNPNFTIK